MGKLDNFVGKEIIEKSVEDKKLTKEEMKKISELYDKATNLDAKEQIKSYLDRLIRTDTIKGLNKLKKEIDAKFQDESMDSYLQEQYSDDLGEENIEKGKENILKDGLKTLFRGIVDGELGNIDDKRKEGLVNDFISDLEKSGMLEQLSKLGDKIDFSEIKTAKDFKEKLALENGEYKEIIIKIGEFLKKIKGLKSLDNLHALKDIKVGSSEKKQIEKALKSGEIKNENNSIFNEGDSFFEKIIKILLAILNMNKELNGLNGDKKIVSSLEKYSKSSEFPLKGKIKAEDLKNLDPKELKGFNKYLKEKGINSNQDNFWEKVLTGKGTKQGDTLYELHTQLVINKKGDILGPKQGLKELVNKLNKIGNKPKIESKTGKKEKTK